LNAPSPPPAAPAPPPLPVAALAVGTAAAAILLPLPFLRLDAGWAQFLGRLHPSVLHFPIALIALALLFDATRLPRVRRWLPAVPDAAVNLVLALAAISAFVAAVAGWMLSHAGGYDPAFLDRHLWTGTATAIGAIACALLRSVALARPERALWRRLGSAALVATAAVMVVASHAGGSLTHGEDYLTEHAPAWVRRMLGLPVKRDRSKEPIRPVEERAAFDDFVLPIFEDRCIACHNPAKLKGNLRLDAHAHAAKAGAEMLRRLRLPPDDEKHMPPRGKPQPAADELAVLEWWIAAGAPGDVPVGRLDAPTGLLEKRLPEEHRRVLEARKREAAAALEAKLADLRRVLPGTLSALTPGAPGLEYTAAAKPEAFGDAQLRELAAVGAQIVRLDLARTRVSDAGLAALAGMPGLERLDLRHTAVTDAGLASLAPLAKLESLGLYGTGVTDAGLEHLKNLTSLRRLYVSYSKVTEEGEKRLRAARPQLEIVR